MSILKHTSFRILSANLAGREEQTFQRVAHKADFDHVERQPGYLYVRSRAISSRINENFDGFDADEIKKGYQTFQGKPVFVSHHNQNHRRARGVIVATALHEDRLSDGKPDTWVEVLMEVDAVKFPKLAQAILAGEIARTSMGTDVEYSRCTFCGNKAYTEAEYCSHIPRLKGKRIRRVNASTGASEEVLVAEQCFGLRFFENSLLVEAPADPSALCLGTDWVDSDMTPHFASANGVDSSIAYAEAVANSPQRELSTTSAPFADRNQREQLVLDDENFFFGQHVSSIAYTGSRPTPLHHISRVVGVRAENPVIGIMTEGDIASVPDQQSVRNRTNKLSITPSMGPDGASFSIGQRESSVSRVKSSPGPQPTFGRATDRNLRPIPLDFAHGGLETSGSIRGQSFSHEEQFSTTAAPYRGSSGEDHDGPWKRKGSFGGKRVASLQKRALNETVAPPEVDTLRESECPICFTAETLIRTEEGYVPIASIEVGDLVLSSDGEFHVVQEVMENDYDGILYSIKTGSMIRPALVTPDHPFRALVGHHPFRDTCEPGLCAQYGEEYVGKRGFGEEQHITHHLDWVPVQDLTSQSFVATNVPQEDIVRKDRIAIPDQYLGSTNQGRSQRKGPDSFALTEDFLWVLGLYIAEGSNSKRHITFTLHEKEIEYAERVLDFARGAGYTANILPANGKAINVEVYSSVLAEWFPALLGHGSHNKAIPQELMGLPPHQMKALIAGIMAGDGYVKSDRIKQTSPTLALQLAELSIQTGITPGVSFQSGTSRGKKDSYSVLGVQEGRKRSPYWEIEGHMLTRVRDIHRVPYAGKVYNLSVEGDPTYTVQNILVHNCGSDAYNGDECPVCLFIRPPDAFMDPNLEIAQDENLRQDAEDANLEGTNQIMDNQDQTPVAQDLLEAGGGDLECDSCGANFNGDPEVAQADQDSVPPSTTPQAPGAAAGDQPPPPINDESLPLPLGPEDEDDVPPAGAELPKDGDDASDDPKEGDPCPECGKGTVKKKDSDDDDEPEGSDDDKKSDGPPWEKDDKSSEGVKSSSRSRHKESITMAQPTVKVIASLAATNRQQAAEIAQLKRSVNYIAQVAGIAPRRADVNNPANPIPAPPSQGAPSTTEQARIPQAQVDVTQIGATPVAGVGAGATDTVDSIGGTLLDPAYNVNYDVTAPVSGTEGRLPLDQVRTVPVIEFGNPLGNTETAFPTQGDWAQKATLSSQGRSFAALRLARLRQSLGTADVGTEDLVIAASIESNASITDADIAKEIETLSAVANARQPRQAPRQAARRLVPQSPAGVGRTTPSVAADATPPMLFTASSSNDDDAFAFAE